MPKGTKNTIVKHSNNSGNKSFASRSRTIGFHSVRAQRSDAGKKRK